MTEVWQDFATGFGLGSTVYVATNLDNILLICGLMAGGTRRISVTLGFVVAATLIILLASSFTVLSYFVPPAMLGYLGVVPIALGLRILLGRSTGADATVPLDVGSVSVALLLAANSLDTVAAFAPMFAESETVVRFALVAGFIASAVLLLAVVLRFSRRLSNLGDRGPIAQKIAAVIMILVGIYVLSDTATDLE